MLVLELTTCAFIFTSLFSFVVALPRAQPAARKPPLGARKAPLFRTPRPGKPGVRRRRQDGSAAGGVSDGGAARSVGAAGSPGPARRVIGR
ncbi:hypothetical protein W97_04177 [Coniosporium apollinis CBS 100218]|uniref:Secreted protein n=1 Tax=Coniosporium apollinis (strain CBS 100218) TaxID=1168221 RepID=R7YSX8_CONA1|nr:uncharacterized protein W97_04177 [Coniosporium apollinis CBS 100218]EON64943.1 hypothetical protein W97_04177 [Coniosporium apollinis CBS 100218]